MALTKIPAGLLDTTAHVDLLDNEKIRLGTNQDLELYHDGSNSYINDVGTGSLYIKATNLTLADAAGEQFLNAYSNAGVVLYHNNVQKIETTAAGASVTGNLAVSGNLTVSGTTTELDTTNLNVTDKNITLNYHASSDTSSGVDGAGITIQDAVNASTDATLNWSASNDRFVMSHGLQVTSGNVGIGIASPAYDLDIVDTTSASNTNAALNLSHASKPQLRFVQTSNNTRMYIGIDTNDLVIRNDDGVEKVRFEQNGNVGIGNSNPNKPFTVTSDSGANCIALRARSADDYSFMQFFNNAGSALRGQIYSHSSGDIGFTTGTDSSAGNDLYIKNGAGVGIGGSPSAGKLDIVGGISGVSVRVRGDVGGGAYYYGYMFDGSNVRGTTQTNIFYSGSAIAANTTIAEYAGIRIDQPSLSASGAAITNNYGIYQSGSAQKNYFAGNFGIGAAPNTARLRVEQSANSEWAAIIKHAGTSVNYGLSIDTSAGASNAVGALQVYTPAGGGLILTNAGRLGVGNNNPNKPLTVTSDGGANGIAIRARSADDYGFFQFFNNAGTALRGQIYSHSNSIGFTTGTDSSAGNDLYIKDGVGVGIGTTSPDAKFEVEWTGTHNSSDSVARITAPIYPSLEFYSTNTNSNNRNWKLSSVYNSYGTFEFLKSSAANGVPNQSVMALTKDGNVGVGTSTPQEMLHAHSGSTSAAIRASGENNFNKKVEMGYHQSAGPYIKAGSSGITKLQVYVDNTSLAAEFRANGDFYSNDGTVHSLSDSRVKKDIADLTDGLAIVKQLKPRTFKFNGKATTLDDNRTRYGFVADEVMAVASQYVSVDTQTIDGVEVDDFKSLSATKMIPMLVKAIQEQQTLIESLTARIAALEE